MTSRDPEKCREAVRSAILATAWLLVIYKILHGLCGVSLSWPITLICK